MSYPYPITNSDLIRHHKLEKHFEGGYFAQTVALESLVPDEPTWPGNLAKSPSLQEQGREQRPSGPAVDQDEQSSPGKDKHIDATLIYYLLTAESYRGKMHMNLHSHFHLHHAGRALYTLIKPPVNGEQATVRRVVLGPNVMEGEVTQLFVPGGWWKASEIPEEDLKDADKERVGCLISEVVVPGWQPEQHIFLDKEKLDAMGLEGYDKYLTSA